MITFSSFIVFACITVALFMLSDFLKSNKRLFSKIQGLAPGAIAVTSTSRSKRLRNFSKAQAEQIDGELVDIVAMISATLLAGESIFAALFRIVQTSKSSLASELNSMLQRIELGGRFDAELIALCQRIPTDSIREFASKLSLAMARGTPLAESLQSLARSVRASHSAAVLRRAGVNETKMLIPVVLLICPVTVIFALYPSSQFLTLGFN